jgi:phenylacetic acid degradation operon negative regulatory protein
VTADILSALRSGSTGSVDLPRSQVGSPPQHLLITLLADYWSGQTEPLPSGALVRLAGEFGVTAVGARAALSRLARRGLLAYSKVGRNTYYGLTKRTAEALEASRHRVLSFGERPPPWDGYWTVAAFSLPEERRDLRHSLRAQLRWLGFAPLFDGMWVSPRTPAAETWQVLKDLEISSATVLRAREFGRPGGRALIDAFDLSSLRELYGSLIDQYEPLVQRIAQGQVSAREALVARTAVMGTWRSFPALDPDLPDELLPEDWPRRAARQVFTEVYNGLGPLAVIRVRQILATSAPGLADLARHLTTAEVLSAVAPAGR